MQFVELKFSNFLILKDLAVHKNKSICPNNLNGERPNPFMNASPALHAVNKFGLSASMQICFHDYLRVVKVS